VKNQKNIFNKYTLLTSISGEITAISDVRIGLGRVLTIIESDLPVIKNSKGVPVIPGSSLKGFFRGNLQRVLKAQLSDDDVERLLNNLFGSGAEKKETDSHGSTVFFHQLTANKKDVLIRKHIKINPETQSVNNLFDVEYVPDDTKFSGKILITRNLSPVYLGLFHLISNLANDEIFKIGGFKSRGYGSISFLIKELELIICGKSIDNLKSGETVEIPLPNIHELTLGFEDNNIVHIIIKNNNKKILDTTIDATVEDDINYLGCRIKIKDPAAIKGFLNSCLNALNENFDELILVH